MEVTLVLPEGPWAEFARRSRIAAARHRLYEDLDFRAMWMAPWDATKPKAMCDKAMELGEEPDLARAVVRDITGVDPCESLSEG